MKRTIILSKEKHNIYIENTIINTKVDIRGYQSITSYKDKQLLYKINCEVFKRINESRGRSTIYTSWFEYNNIEKLQEIGCNEK